MTTIAAIVLVGLGASSSLPNAVALQNFETIQGRVTHVVNGDTLVVTLGGGSRARIRLEGIDCPEPGQPFAQAARNFTRQLAFDQTIAIRVVDRDQYGRLVARVSVRGKDLSSELVNAGLAWHFLEFSADRLLEGAEKEARAQRRGLWADSNPVPPWAMRRSLPARVSGPFHGNAISGVYHSFRCKNARCKNCTRLFTSEPEAQAAGFRPAGDCLKAVH